MKLSTNKWNITIIGENKPVSYYGYKTKKEARRFADDWNRTHETQVEVIKY